MVLWLRCWGQRQKVPGSNRDNGIIYPLESDLQHVFFFNFSLRKGTSYLPLPTSVIKVKYTP